MKIGISLPHLGPVASPEAIKAVAQRAEELGYDALWVLERTLVPVDPMNPYPASRDGRLPDQYKIVVDPIETLTFAAAHTRKIRLGTSVIVINNHNPLILARRLASLDFLSGGRLICGFGVGWSKDEILAAGNPYDQRGARADEFVRVLKKIWTEDPVEFSGQFFTIPKSFIGPKPVQKPHPPIIFGGFVGKTFGRIIEYGNGWNPVSGIPLEHLKGMIDGMRSAAIAAGKRPEDYEVVLRAFKVPSKEEYQKWEEIGVTHIVLSVEFGVSDVAGFLKQAEAIGVLRG